MISDSDQRGCSCHCPVTPDSGWWAALLWRDLRGWQWGCHDGCIPAGRGHTVCLVQRTRKYPCYSRPLEVSQDAQLQTNVPKKRVEGKKLEMRGESIRHDEQRESKGTLITFAIGAKQGSLPLAMVNVWRCSLWSRPISQRNPYSSTVIAVLSTYSTCI